MADPTTTTDGGLTALQMLQDMFVSYGMGDLATTLGDMLKDPTNTSATITLNLENSDAYKARFPAMAALRQRGEAITEGAYISQEQSYSNIMRNYGLPAGFYDKPADFSTWMTNGVAPTEVEQRIQSAQAILNSSDPNLMATAKNYYGLDNGSLLANVLDGTVAQPIIQRQLQTIDLGAAAAKGGFNLSQQQAYGYAGSAQTQNQSYAQLVSSFGEAGLQAQNQQKLATIQGDGPIDPNQSIDAVVLGDANATMASRSRAMDEKARFEGRNGIGATSLAQQGI